MTDVPVKPCARCNLSPRQRRSYCLTCAREVFAIWRKKDGRSWEVANPKRTIFRNKKGSAKYRGIPFTLTFEDVVWPEKCPVLGTVLEYVAASGRGQRDPRVTPSFDRIDPSKGYEVGNVQIISVAANRIKAEFSAAEVGAVAEWLRSLDRSK